MALHLPSSELVSITEQFDGQYQRRVLAFTLPLAFSISSFAARSNLFVHLAGASHQQSSGQVAAERHADRPSRPQDETLGAHQRLGQTSSVQERDVSNRT